MKRVQRKSNGSISRVERKPKQWHATFAPDFASPDLCARRVIVAAYCYYVLDQPIMSDTEYDWLSRYVADNWERIEYDRRWALDTPDKTRSGGSHIFFAEAAVRAAYARLFELKIEPRFPLPSVWKNSKTGRRFVTCRSAT